MINEEKMQLNKETALRLWTKQFGNCQKAIDFAGREIAKAAYNDRNSKYGWNVDHILPQSRGGKTIDSNLICCHILTNDEKADKFPCFTANGRQFEIQKKQNHYEIVQIDGQQQGQQEDLNLFDSADGIDFYKKCKGINFGKKFLGYVKILIEFSESPYERKSNKKNIAAIYQFVSKLFDTNAIIVDTYDSYYSSKYIFTIIDYDIETKEDTQNLLDDCILLNTYGKYYFIRNGICDNMTIACGMDCLDSPLNVNSREIESILNFNSNSNCHLIISDLIKINTDAKKNLEGLNRNWYEYDYYFTKLKENLSKN